MESRQTEKCRQAPGVVRPIVNAARCEGKADCVSVCPFDVFEIDQISKELFDGLSLFSKLRVWAHGMKTATTPNASACEGCGYCVAACPERAIRLERARV
jgi:4Fe-4S ferredoxin